MSLQSDAQQQPTSTGIAVDTSNYERRLEIQTAKRAANVGCPVEGSFCNPCPQARRKLAFDLGLQGDLPAPPLPLKLAAQNFGHHVESFAAAAAAAAAELAGVCNVELKKANPQVILSGTYLRG